MNSFHIEGRRWFDSRYGNTYYSVVIYQVQNDKLEIIGRVPCTYGYGEHYLQSALEWLEERGYIEREQYPNGSKPSGTRYIREELNSTYSVSDITRKRDL